MLPNDNCRQAVNMSFVNTSGMNTTNQDKTFDYRHSQILITESSQQQLESPAKTKVIQEDYSSEYPTE